jgi:hypothetical protein
VPFKEATVGVIDEMIIRKFNKQKVLGKKYVCVSVWLKKEYIHQKEKKRIYVCVCVYIYIYTYMPTYT